MIGRARAALYTLASPEAGKGHLTRCLALKEAFEARGVDVQIVEADGPGSAVLGGREEIAVFDLPRWHLLAPGVLEQRRERSLVVTIDDWSTRRHEADMAYYPPVPQFRKLSWKRPVKRLCDWRYVLLRSSFRNMPRRLRVSKTVKKVLVSCGGADKHNFSTQVVRGCSYVGTSFEVTVVVGPYFGHRRKLDAAIKDCAKVRPCTVLTGVEDLSRPLFEADLAFVAYGVTAFEALAAGCPVVLICASAEHLEASKTFLDAKVAGRISATGSQADVARGAMETMVHIDGAARLVVSRKGQQLVDGRGAERIVDEIVRRLRHGDGEERRDEVQGAPLPPSDPPGAA